MTSPDTYNPEAYRDINEPGLTPEQRYNLALDVMMRLAGVTYGDIEQAQITNDESNRESARLRETAMQAWCQTSGALAVSGELQLAG